MSNWDDISGQEKLKQYFDHAIRNKQISHAYILEGEPGTPKLALAKSFARMLQCEKGIGCGECHSCKAMASGNHPDVMEIRHEKPDTIRIDEIRNQLIDDMGIRPYSSPYKIYIVDEAEKMNIAAQNALLKTLEEPPYYGIIILCTVNSGKFLPTILSRTILLKCQSSGSGLEMLEEEQRQMILSVLKNAWNYDRTNMAEAASKLAKSEIPTNLWMNLVRVWIRDILIRKDMGEDQALILKDELHAIHEAADRYSYEQLNRILMAADQTEQRIASNVNFELAVEMFLAEMKIHKKIVPEYEDPCEDMHFPDFEEAQFYNDSYEEAMSGDMIFEP